jgi:hypothetical protein
MSTVTERTAIDGAAVDELRASFRGEVVSPADAGYDEHRKIWNGSIDRRPGSSPAAPAWPMSAPRFGSARARVDGRRAGGGHSFPGCRCAMTACSSTSGP